MPVVYDYMPQTVGSFSLSAGSGSGVGIAVIDSGIMANPDLTNATGRSRIVYSESFVPGTSDAGDYYGHGTHVAGIIAGNGYRSSGSSYYHLIKGVAPSANLINTAGAGSKRQFDGFAGDSGHRAGHRAQEYL